MKTTLRPLLPYLVACVAIAAPSRVLAESAASPPPFAGTNFWRAEIGLNAPEGLLGLALGRALGPRLSAELLGGFGAGANFVGVTGRFHFGPPGPGWRFGLGIGGSLGFNKDSCCIEDEAPPDSPSYWLHQELSVSRLARRRLSILVAVGAEELVGGAYHADVAEVNFADRKAIDVQPYLRAGIGLGF